MTLLQKLTSIINQDLMRIHFSLPGYDFVLDPSHKKKPNAQKEFKAFVMQDMGNDQTPVTIYLNDNAYRLTKKDIIDIFDYINDVAGVNVITYKTANVTGVAHPVFDITDTDLAKQQQIKQIRAQNKALGRCC
jgi:aspartate carbamoyltransferase regulatory subunit